MYIPTNYEVNSLIYYKKANFSSIHVTGKSKNLGYCT